MIDFLIKNNSSSFWGDDKEMYSAKVKDIKSCVSKSALDKYELGRKLIDFWNSDRYSYGAENHKIIFIYPKINTSFNLHSDNFFIVCEYEFGLEKSVVSRLMNIVDEFGDGEKGFKKEFSKYKYSVLVEMLSLSPEERKEIKPEWTVTQVRNFKKSLVATSQQDEDVKADKPKEEYPQFKSWKRLDFIKRILALEKENNELQKRLENNGG